MIFYIGQVEKKIKAHFDRKVVCFLEIGNNEKNSAQKQDLCLFPTLHLNGHKSVNLHQTW